jgi:hypothetical protein
MPGANVRRRDTGDPEATLGPVLAPTAIAKKTGPAGIEPRRAGLAFVA